MRASPAAICDDRRLMRGPHDQAPVDRRTHEPARAEPILDGVDRDADDASRDGGQASTPTADWTEDGRLSRASSSGRPAVAFGLTATVAFVGLVASWLILVGTAAGQRLENAALRGAEFRSEPERQAALDRLSQVTVTVFVLAILACFVVGQLRKRGWLATTVVVAMGSAAVLAELLKDVLARPPLVDGPVWILRNSFPSGSAVVATAVAVGLYLVAPDRLRWLALSAGVVGAAVISEAVQTSGWHRLSDTIGATCLTIAVLFGGLWALARAGRVHAGEHGHVDARVAGGLWLAASVVLTFGTIVLVLVALFPVLTTPVDARQALLQTAFPLIGTGWTIVAILAAARIVEPYTLGTAASARPFPGGHPLPAPEPRPVGSGPTQMDDAG
jgi:hypothetical protein